MITNFTSLTLGIISRCVTAASLVFVTITITILCFLTPARPATPRTLPTLHPIRTLPHIYIPTTHRLTFWTLLPLPTLPPIILIRTLIMPPDPTLAVITPYPKRHNLPTPLAIPDAYCGLIVLVERRLVVRFFQVGREFHECARREGVVACAREVQEVVCEQGVEDGVGFGDGDARVGLRVGVAVVQHAGGLALARAPGPRELRRVHLLYGHCFAGGRVVGFEHGVQQAPDVGYFVGGEAGCELGEGVGGLVYDGVGADFGLLVDCVADFEVVGFDFRVDRLDYGDDETFQSYVAYRKGTVGVCGVLVL